MQSNDLGRYRVKSQTRVVILSVSAGAKIAVAVVTKTRNDMELFIDLLVHS